MELRPIARTRRFALHILGPAVLVLAMAGCDPRMFMYFLQPFDPMVNATGPDLRGKTVAILTHASAGTLTDLPTLDRDVAKEFTALLREGVKRIELVPAAKVHEWVEANPNWTEAGELGRAVGADVVILLEIESFRIQDPNSPGMLQGNSKVHVQVTELGPKKGEETPEPQVIYTESTETLFPDRAPMPMDAKTNPSAFRSKFLKLVATELSWHFVKHAVGDDIQDTRI